ncbi:MAG: hypothetical protein NC041_09930 [Bacteroides sp.]|nr:hypothetical protein [Prevotella sp.]MCM1408870.1 hypothetical protein [Treponema brennaborense]MCM1470770.1 hypothetical protein [Bacteroides sp.]
MTAGKNLLAAAFAFSVCANFFAADFSRADAERFRLLLRDLYSYGTFGYKKSAAETAGGFVQGAVQMTERDEDFAVIGEGFFALGSGGAGRRVFTRCGRFFGHQGGFHDFAGRTVAAAADGGFLLFVPAHGCKIQSDDGVHFYFSKALPYDGASNIIKKCLETSDANHFETLQKLTESARKMKESQKKADIVSSLESLAAAFLRSDEKKDAKSFYIYYIPQLEAFKPLLYSAVGGE